MLIAIGNAGDAALAPEAERLLDDASPLVRGAAVWALSQLTDREKFEALASQAIDVEADEAVRAEWRHNRQTLILRSAKRVSKDESPASWFETAQQRLLTMRNRHTSRP